MLEEIKQKIIQVNKDIEKAKSNQRKRQLLKYRLEKQVMTYMFYRYGVILKKDKWGDTIGKWTKLNTK